MRVPAKRELESRDLVVLRVEAARLERRIGSEMAVHADGLQPAILPEPRVGSPVRRWVARLCPAPREQTR